MIRPGVTFALWCAIAVLVLVNDMIGDTLISDRLTEIMVQWYKVLVPLPYVVMMAVIHARRTKGPQWRAAAVLAAVLWSVTTAIVDFGYERVTLDHDASIFLDRFAVAYGAPYPLLVLTLFAAPLLAGWAMAKKP
ncbi:MAG: hypothetical protein J0J01_08005 [Reyranella sp.]|uniref:hypothetical protein n=1 Tax=Reyranella sp. TaxID=1929291 RepID=UPI001AC5C652|nr:hypothetical protein [Reyranella sp.]MBN9086836.1 hypothetical protein [Reyranella sp.]